MLCLSLFVIPASASDDPRQTETSAPNELRIGYTHFAPFVYVDENGALRGIDVELAQAACRKMGCSPVFIPINWHLKDFELEEGRIDCVWTVFSKTGRERDYQWTTSYLRSRQMVAVPKTSSVVKLSDLHEKHIATTHDSKAETLLLAEQRLGEPAEVYSFSVIDEAFSSLEQGFVDAIASHEATLKYFMDHSAYDWRFLSEPLAVVDVGVAFAPSADPARVNALSRTLSDFAKDGTLQSILKKYNYVEPAEK